MLSIPNICASSYVVGMKFRFLGEPPEGRTKYDAVTGLPGRLYNLQALNIPSDVIVLTEGELDAVIINQLGIPAIGVPGANAWKPHHERVLENYERVVLIRDPDAAGGALVKKVMATDLPVQVIEPVEGDVNEAVLAGYGDALLAAIRGEDA